MDSEQIDSSKPGDIDEPLGMEIAADAVVDREDTVDYDSFDQIDARLVRVAINAVDDINPTESSNDELVGLVGTIYATIIRLCNTIRGSSKIYDRLCLDFPEGVAEKVLQIAKLQDKSEKDPNAPILVLHQQLAAAMTNELKSKDYNFT